MDSIPTTGTIDLVADGNADTEPAPTGTTPNTVTFPSHTVTAYDTDTYWVRCRVYDANTLSDFYSVAKKVTVAVADETKPYFTTIPAAQSTEYNQRTTGVDFEGADLIEFDSYAVNDSKFQINSTGWFNDTELLGVGVYYINVTINDSVNNLNSTIYNVNITQNVSLALGLTATPTITYGQSTDFQTSISGCPSELDCSLNITDGIFSAGTISANYSTAGNANYSAKSATFTVTIDQAIPEGNLTSDLGWTINETQEVTISSSNSNTGDDDLTYIIYRNNVSQGESDTWNPAFGTYEYILNTTGGTNWTANASMDTKTLTVLDNIFPNIAITYPSNNSNWTNVNLDVNFTRSDTNLDSCWYSNDTYLVNKTLPSCGNLTNVAWSDGKHNVTIWVNDSGGNENSSKISFTIDTTPPYFTNWANKSVTEGDSLNYNIDATDAGVGVESFAINWTTQFNITITEGVLRNSSELLEGEYYINVSINDTLGNLNSGILLVNVTTISDLEYPVFSSPTETPSEPRNYSFGQTYEFNITLISTNGTVGLDFNGTNYTATNSSGDSTVFNYTFSDLSAGNYTYYWWSFGNGSLTLFNDSIIYSYNISKAIPQGSISGSSPINYLDNGNVEGSESNDGDDDVGYKLYRDDIEVSSPDTTVLGAGDYNYIYNATGGQNYSDNSSIGTFELTVDKIASEVNLTLNKEQKNITINQGQAIDLNCSTITGDSSAYLALYREETLINNGTSAIGNTTTFNTVQVENITCTYQNTQNYTTSSDTWWVNVTDNINPDITIAYPSNNSNHSNVNLDVNYTASDNSALSDCWWSNDTMSVNHTLTDCGTNITDIVWNEGKHNVTVWANDTSGNENHSTVTFTIDLTNPDINIVYPSNNSNHSNVNLDVNFTRSDTNLDSCWYSNDTYLVNKTLPSCGNVTNVIWSEGQHNVTVWANDTAGLENSSSVTFTIDTVKPNIAITYPSNNTNWTNVNLDVNFTRSDTNLDSCWYSNDTYLKNTTLENCGNVTNVAWSDGKHNVTIWANDTSGNENSSSISFRIDTTPPYFTDWADQTSPETNSLNYDINAADAGVGVQSFAINWTTQFNITASEGVLRNSSALSIGEYYINVSINDTLGNLHSDILLVTVTAVDNTNPHITIAYPSNNSNHSNINLDVNYTASDETSLDDCWWSNDTMLVNHTLTNCGTNITDIVWSEGNHNVTVWANDTSGNENSSTITFTIELTKPNIEIVYPSNNSNHSVNTIDVNYTASDSGVGLDSCWYSNDTYLKNTTLDGCGNLTNVVWSDGKHNVTIWANDTAGNENSSSITFTIDTTSPYFTTIPAAQSVEYNQRTTGVDFDATDETEFDSYTVNDTRFQINSTGWFNDTSILEVGNYYINITINDSLNNLNSTIYNVNITQNVSLVLGLTATPTITYGESTNFQESGCPSSELTCTLNLTNAIFGAGTISANYSTAGNANYSAESATFTVTINQASPVGSLTNSLTTWTINETQEVTIEGSDSNTGDDDVDYNVSRDGVNKGTSDTWFPTIGTYSYVLNTTGGTNWSANANMDSETLTVLDNIFPNIDIVYPSNNSNWTNVNLDVNFTRSDTNLDSCWYSNDTYLKNTTLENCGNVTNVAWSDGKHNVTIWANDTSGNENSSSISFRIDTTPPYFTDWADQTSPETNSLNYDINAADAGVGVQSFAINWTIQFNITASDGVLKNSSGLSIGEYYINVSINDTLGNLHSDILLVNITPVDNTPPYFTDNTPQNQTIEYNIPLSYDINATDGTTFDSFTVNDSRFKISDSGLLENNVILNVSIHYLNITINDSSNNLNSTIMFVNVTKATFVLSISADPDWTGTYGTAVNISGSGCPSQLTCNLNKNDTGEITNSQSVIYGAGYSSFTYNTTGNENYTSASVSNILSISQKTSVVNTYLNHLTSNITINQGDSIYLNGTLATGQAGDSIKLYSNETLINEGTSPLSNYTLFDIKGIYNITTIYAGNENYTSSYETWWVEVTDITNPNIEIVYPSNNTNWTNINLDVNYTASDTNLDSCWYSNDTYLKNTTLPSCGNVTNVIWSEGKHNVTVWANDTAGNENSSRITFTIDLTNPNINITTPSNNTNHSNSNLDVNFTRSDTNLDSCWYSNDTMQKNTTLPSCGNVTDVIWSQGKHNVTVWANDSAGNENASRISFTIDTINPDISITYPSNNTNWSNTGLDVNYTASDNKALDSCWYSNDTYLVNKTLPSCGNVTNVVWAQGQHNVTVWANDTSGNENSSSISFTIDSVPPSFTKIKDVAIHNGSSLNYDVDANDVTNDLDCFALNVTPNFEINCSGWLKNTTATEAKLGTYYINVTINDTLNNINSDIMRINIVQINKTNFTGSTTNFLQVPDLSNITNLVIDNPSHGKINSLEEINLENGTSLDNYVNISENRIEINSTIFPNLNKSATIYIYNLTLSNPRVLRNEIVCPLGICTENSYNAGTGNFSFNVTHFTVYSAEETPAGVITPPSTGGGATTITYECTQDSDCEVEDEVCWNNQCVKLFDIKIIDFESPIELGEFFDFTYFLKGMADINDDVTIQFWIKKEGQVVTSGSDIMYFGDFEEKTETTKIFLPSNVESGVYTFFIQVIYKEYTATSHRVIEIAVGEDIPTIIPTETKNIGTYISIGTLLLFVLILFIIFRVERKKIKSFLIKEDTWIKRYKSSFGALLVFLVLIILAFYLNLFNLFAQFILSTVSWFKTNVLPSIFTILTILFILILLIIIIKKIRSQKTDKTSTFTTILKKIKSLKLIKRKEESVKTREQRRIRNKKRLQKKERLQKIRSIRKKARIHRNKIRRERRERRRKEREQRRGKTSRNRKETSTKNRSERKRIRQELRKKRQEKRERRKKERKVRRSKRKLERNRKETSTKTRSERKRIRQGLRKKRLETRERRRKERKAHRGKNKLVIKISSIFKKIKSSKFIKRKEESVKTREERRVRNRRRLEKKERLQKIRSIRKKVRIHKNKIRHERRERRRKERKELRGKTHRNRKETSTKTRSERKRIRQELRKKRLERRERRRKERKVRRSNRKLERNRKSERRKTGQIPKRRDKIQKKSKNKLVIKISSIFRKIRLRARLTGKNLRKLLRKETRKISKIELALPQKDIVPTDFKIKVLTKKPQKKIKSLIRYLARKGNFFIKSINQLQIKKRKKVVKSAKKTKKPRKKINIWNIFKKYEINALHQFIKPIKVNKIQKQKKLAIPRLSKFKKFLIKRRKISRYVGRRFRLFNKAIVKEGKDINLKEKRIFKNIVEEIEQIFKNVSKYLHKILGRKSRRKILGDFEKSFMKTDKFAEKPPQILNDIADIEREFKKKRLRMEFKKDKLHFQNRIKKIKKNVTFLINGLIKYLKNINSFRKKNKSVEQQKVIKDFFNKEISREHIRKPKEQFGKEIKRFGKRPEPTKIKIFDRKPQEVNESDEDALDEMFKQNKVKQEQAKVKQKGGEVRPQEKTKEELDDILDEIERKRKSK